MFHHHQVPRAARAVLAAVLLLGAFLPAVAFAQEDPSAAQVSGYTITDDAIGAFFNQHGGEHAFGEPVSRELSLFGRPTQLFQKAALQVMDDGSVQALALAGDSLLPYTSFDGLTVPAADPALAFIAPAAGEPNYPARLQVFLQAVVREPFASAYGDAAVLGLPTSYPKPDPNNPNFVYQRFQNGILFYDASSGTTQLLPLGEYLKDILVGEGLPTDLQSEAANSPLLRLHATGDAFVPDAS